MSRFLEINEKLDKLTIFRGILKDPAIDALRDLAVMINSPAVGGDSPDRIQSNDSRYCNFVSKMYTVTADFSLYVKTLVLHDENFYVRDKAAKKRIPKVIEDHLEVELDILQSLAELKSADIKKLLSGGPSLPSWHTSKTDIKAEYKAMIEALSVKGYGMYARYRAFCIKDGRICPVKYPDTRSLDQLFEYEKERSLIIKNTEALVSGKGASNILLYGDAGTGKSSTVKAVAKEYADRGLRLIEIKKEQLHQITDVIDELSSNPLNFILFIDDLSFTGNDDNFSALKAVLEGSISSFGRNIAIYATSNRRHLIKEFLSDRLGDDLHLNDTLQEMTSLAARFGLTITFSKPDRDDYLSIVEKLASQYDVQMPREKLFAMAERFAIRANGRSPRVARQFIELQKIGITE